jgi:hypothetical protein
MLMRVLRRLRADPLAKKANDPELAVVSMILAGDDRRLAILLEQFTRGPITRTRPADHMLVVSLDYTSSALMFPFEVTRLESPWCELSDPVSGKELKFRVVVVRGGFLKALEGRTRDETPWPAGWTVGPGQSCDPANRLTLPSLQEFEEQQKRAHDDLGRWLAASLPPGLDTFPPPTDAQIASRELALGGALPASLREFYRITDGLESSDLRLFGHADIYTIDNVNIAAVLLTWDADDRDNFVVVASLGGSDDQIYRIDIHDKAPEPFAIASDFRSYLAARIADVPSRDIREQ